MDIRDGKIVMPTIYVPSWTEMFAQAGVGLRGEMEWELFERHGGKEVVVRRGKQRNLIVDAGRNRRCNLLYLGTASLLDHMVVGTGTTEPSVSQNSLVTQLGDRKKYSSYAYADSGTLPFYCTWVFEFQEDECNGDLTEWGMFYGSTGATMWCRELFRDQNGDPVVVTKTDTQVLRFTYKLYYQRTADSSTAVITADGTEYTCTTTINNAQMESIAMQGITNNYVILGTSNTASDIVNDRHDEIKGAQIGRYDASQCPLSYGEYIVDSFKRSQIVTIGGSYGNGDIGEILFQGNNSRCYCRITYTPTIPKTTSKKLYLGVEWSFSRA
jgi:hypothetical protein